MPIEEQGVVITLTAGTEIGYSITGCKEASCKNFEALAKRLTRGKITQAAPSEGPKQRHVITTVGSGQ